MSHTAGATLRLLLARDYSWPAGENQFPNRVCQRGALRSKWYRVTQWSFIAKTPLQLRVRLETHLVVMCTMSQCKLRSPFRNLRARKERNLHCDVVHDTTKLMGLYTRSGSRDRSDPDVAIKAYDIRFC